MTFEDSGTYVCIARNQYGSVNRTHHLNVIGKLCSAIEINLWWSSLQLINWNGALYLLARSVCLCLGQCYHKVVIEGGCQLSVRSSLLVHIRV